jgi:hypothetical protein
MTTETIYEGTEIYKITNNKWGIVIKDTNGNYITTICSTSRKNAVELVGNPEMLKWNTDRLLKKQK